MARKKKPKPKTMDDFKRVAQKICNIIREEDLVRGEVDCVLALVKQVHNLGIVEEFIEAKFTVKGN